MNEQQLQQAYTRHCETTGQTKTTRTGFEDFKAGFRLAQSAAGEPVAPIGYANPKHLARMAAGEMGSVSVLAERSPDENHTAPVFGAPPAVAHGDEAAILVKALSLLWETTNFLTRGGSLDGRVSAFLAQHAPEPVASAAAMRAQGDGGEA